MAKLPYCLGKHLRSPYETLEDFKLHPGFIKALTESKLNRLSDLHKAVGPNIFKGSDAIVVGDGHSDAAQSKRLTSYLLPIIQVIHELLRAESYSKEIKTSPSTGPMVLILTSTQTNASFIETLLQTLLHGKRKPPIHTEYVSELKKSRKIPDIMVSDMTAVEQMRRNSKMGRLLFERLRFLVFEETNAYNMDQWDAMKEIVDISLGFEDSICQTNPVQLVFTASKWSSKFEQFYLDLLKKKRNICLFIDLLPELIKFAKICWKVDLVDDEEIRKKKLLDILRQHQEQSEKIVISCEYAETAEEIKKYCSKAGFCLDIFTDSSSKYEPNADSPCIALVIPDDNLVSLHVQDYTNVVNYDSSNQRQRLKSLWGSLPTVNYASCSLNRKALTCLSLMTGKESNYLPFYRFLKMLERVDIHPDLDDIGDKLHKAAVLGKPLCDQVKLLGSCERVKDLSCYNRHSFVIDDLKEVPLAPCYGEVEVSILKCISPSHYIGVLNQHFSIDGESRTLVKSYEQEREDRERILREHYSDESKQAFPRSIEKGMVYAFKSGQTYRRVRLEGKVMGQDRSDSSKISVLDKVMVQCLDTGLKEVAIGTELISLESFFQDWKQHKVDIVLCNVCPPNNNPTYTPVHCSKAREMVSAHKKFKAKVWISVGETLWVNPMISMDAENISLRSKLIESKVAASNGIHLDYLCNSLRTLGELYPGFQYLRTLRPRKNELCQDCHKQSDKFDWAFVEKSSIHQVNGVEMKITYAQDPWLFYGIIAKQEELLENLESEINAWAVNISCEPEFYEKLEPNAVVAVKKNEAQMWARGLVLEKWKEESQFMFDVFLVDNGETVLSVEECEILPILRKFVSQLPFQCIGFSLSHIKPLTDPEDWTVAEKQVFWDLVLPDGFSSYVTVAVLDDIGSIDAENVPCRYYSAVIALDGKELGAKLVEEECAISLEKISDRLIVPLLSKDKEVELDKLVIEDLDSLTMDDSEDENEFYERFDINLEDSHSKDPSWMDEFVASTMDKYEQIKADIIAASPVLSGGKEKQSECKLEDIATCSKKANTPPSTENGIKQDKPLTPEQELIREINNVLRHPTVLWHQNESDINLNVQLPDLKEYELKISRDGRRVRFQTIVPYNYGFYLNLFGRVLQNPQVDIYGLYVRISLTKKHASDVPWCRLLQDKDEKPKWLKENPEYLRDDDDEQDDSYPIIQQTYSEKYEDIGSTDSCDDDDDDEDFLFRASEKFLKYDGFFDDGDVVSP